MHANANYDRAEYAVLVCSDLKGRGLGWVLMQFLLEYARAEGLQVIEGQVLAENTAMLAMCKELGFEIAPDPDEPDTYVVRLVIAKAQSLIPNLTPDVTRMCSSKTSFSDVMQPMIQINLKCDQIV